MSHDWNQYEPSEGLGSRGWMVIERRPDGTQIEAFVLANPDTPVTVRLVRIGPRGGVGVVAMGSARAMREDLSVLLRLIQVADELEALR